MSADTQPPLDFGEFHREWLPARIAAGHGRPAGVAMGVAAVPLAVSCGGETFSYRLRDGGVDVEEGAVDGATMVALDDWAWRDFVCEVRTSIGLMYSNRVKVGRGNVMDFVRWEPALRAVYHGRPIFDRDATAPSDRGGTPLEAGRVFRHADLQSGSADLREYVKEMGFGLVRGALSSHELKALRSEVERLRAGAEEDDPKTWWATRADETRVLCRIVYSGEHSSLIQQQFDNPAVRRMADLVRPGLVPAVDRLDGAILLFKHRDIVQGLSDLPWHRDCGLGGHPIICPKVLVGVHLEDGSADKGELRALPGSWRGSCQMADVLGTPATDGVAIPIQAGDFTVHLGDVLHASVPPKSGEGPCRDSLYFIFVRPSVFDAVAPGKSFNDVLFDPDGGEVEAIHRKLGISVE